MRIGRVTMTMPATERKHKGVDDRQRDCAPCGRLPLLPLPRRDSRAASRMAPSRLGCDVPAGFADAPVVAAGWGRSRG